MGITPNLVGGVWVGGEDQSVHLKSAGEGSVVALPIFGDFMEKVYENPALGISKEDKFYHPIGAIEYNCPDEVIPDEELDDEFFN